MHCDVNNSLKEVRINPIVIVSTRSKLEPLWVSSEASINLKLKTLNGSFSIRRTSHELHTCIKNHVKNCGTLMHQQLFDFVAEVCVKKLDELCLPGAGREGKEESLLLVTDRGLLRISERLAVHREQSSDDWKSPESMQHSSAQIVGCDEHESKPWRAARCCLLLVQSMERVFEQVSVLKIIRL